PCSGVYPWLSFEFTSAPHSSIRKRTAASRASGAKLVTCGSRPKPAAACSGDAPELEVILGFAPAASRIFIAGISLAFAASQKAVAPSGLIQSPWNVRNHSFLPRRALGSAL